MQRMSQQRSKDVLRATLPIMSRHAFDYEPATYAIWYTHVAGSNPALSAEIEQALRATPRISTATTFDLYSRYVIGAAERAVMTAQTGLLDTLGRAEASMRAADAEVARFDNHLGHFDERIGSADSIEELRSDISEVRVAAARTRQAMHDVKAEAAANQMEVMRLRMELERTREEAATDAMTGLSNRRGFDDARKRLALQADQTGTALSVLLLDVDHFKRINDRYGHAFGDEVLTGVAAAVKALVKGRDVAARLGGDEMALLLPDTALAGAMVVATRIRVSIARGVIRPGTTEENTDVDGVTVSIGVAERQSGETTESMLDRADKALYVAKQQGRNRIVSA
jgi:diguanylate cyclase